MARNAASILSFLGTVQVLFYKQRVSPCRDLRPGQRHGEPPRVYRGLFPREDGAPAGINLGYTAGGPHRGRCSSRPP